MSSHTCGKKKIAFLIVAMSLFAVGCSAQAQSDSTVTPAPSATEYVSATFNDVKAGKACIMAVVSVPVWIETDREYIGKNGYCKYAE